jgi:hypothetical protein
MNRAHSMSMTARLLGATLASIALVAMCSAKPTDSIEKRAITDLEKRLGVPASKIKVAAKRKMVWSDSALGLPRVGENVTNAKVTGSRTTLIVDGLRYVYHCTTKTARFAGPLVLQGDTLLALYLVKNEPNLNGNLYEVSCAGIANRLLMKGVSRFQAQAESDILAVRRTSRSGHELLWLDPPADKDVVTLCGAFDFGGFARDIKTNKWAAVVREGLGGRWVIKTGALEPATGSVETMSCPEAGVPTLLAYGDGKLYAQAKGANYVRSGLDENGTWVNANAYAWPGQEPVLLNKSQELRVITEVNGGKPSTKVMTVWFTGDKTVVATLPGFSMTSFSLLHDGWVIVFGKKGGKPTTMLVNLSKGHKLACDLGDYLDAQVY